VKNCKFCNSGSATLLASYLAKCKRFIAHFSYIACDQCQPERVFFKVEKTASAARASMSEDRLEATLVLIQTHRDKTLSIDAVIDSFATKTTSSSRRFIFSCMKADIKHCTVAYT
jgi:hypothetical protein